MFFKRVICVLASICLVLVSMPHTYAQEKVGGSGLSISPTRAEFVIKPGAAENIQITIKNISGVDITAKAEVNDFEADNLTGEPKILVNGKSNPTASLKKFLVGVENVSLKKDESRKLDIPVQIPDKAVSGSYYGVIRFTAAADRKEEAASKQVSLTASVGFLVLVQVPGNITEQLQAKAIRVERNGSGGSVFIAPPQKAKISVKNVGNGLTKPFGRVSITRNGKEVYHYELNNTDPRSNVLPGSQRFFTDDIKEVSGLGRYTISANVSYGTGGSILVLKSNFWVLPLWSVITLVIVFVLLSVIGYLIYSRMNRKRDRRHRRG